MNRENKKIYDRLVKEKLPPGWQCVQAWPYRDHTHLVAPQRSGGVIVQKWHVYVQLPGTGPARDTIHISYDYKGRGWLDRIVTDAVKAAFEHVDKFPTREALTIQGKLGTHATAVYEVRASLYDDEKDPNRDLDEPPSVGDEVEIRSEDDHRVTRWTPVLVDEIKFGKLYYMAIR